MTSLVKPFQSLSTSGDSVDVFAKKKKGSAGTSVQLKTNFFRINLTKKPDFYQFNFEANFKEYHKIEADDLNPTSSSTPTTTSIKSTQPAKVSKNPRKGRKAALASKNPNESCASVSKPVTTKVITSEIDPIKLSIESNSKKLPDKICDQIFQELLNQYPVFKGNFSPVFDCQKNFYSLTKFNLDNNRWFGLVNIIKKEQLKRETFLVNVTKPEQSHNQNFENLLKSNKIIPLELQAINILLRNGPRRTKVSVKSEIYRKSTDKDFEKFKFPIDETKYGLFGCYQAVEVTENGINLNVDRSLAFFTVGGRLIELVEKFMSSSNELSFQNKKKVEDLIKQMKFNPIHLPYKRPFIISGLSDKLISEIKFSESDQDNQISVLDYYKKKYPEFCKKNPLNSKLPCVQVGKRQNAKFFPIEVVECLSNELFTSKLKPALQSKVTVTSSQQKPEERFKVIEEHVKIIKNDNVIEQNGVKVDYLQEFGVSISDQLETVTGRVIDAPKLVYQNHQKIDPKRKGQWNLENQKFYNACSIGDDWVVYNFKLNSRKSANFSMMDKFMQTLVEKAKLRGIVMTPKKIEDFKYRGKNTLEQDLFKKVRSNIKLILILIPADAEESTNVYNEVKYLSETKFGIITQVSNPEKWFKSQEQFCENVLLKINTKLGGTNHSIEENEMPPILRGNRTMLIGLDVTHPSKNDALDKSIAAVVASYTNRFDKFFHELKVQSAKKELVDTEIVMKNLLRRYYEVNKYYPDKIIMFRDGIGIGDFEHVIDYELTKMKKACEELVEHEIKFTYIIVQKRHNTRFMKINESTRNLNVDPGTVVDSGITNRKLFEYYLCSQFGASGTSRPSKYVVLVDENNLSADELHKATYFICYLFPRCNKPKSIPVPVAYSHLLAKRARSYLSHLDESDGQSSVGSGKGSSNELSQGQLQLLNDKIKVQEQFNGTLFFV